MAGQPTRTSKHAIHEQHAHTHGSGCSHKAVKHGEHTDYLHDGHLHRIHGDHVDDCTIAVDATHPDTCTPSHACAAHEKNHRHGSNCGHASLPHGDHVDYLVGGHLHHVCSGHCDDHGVLLTV